LIIPDFKLSEEQIDPDKEFYKRKGYNDVNRTTKKSDSIGQSSVSGTVRREDDDNRSSGKCQFGGIQ
jgi:hypothetical protein